MDLGLIRPPRARVQAEGLVARGARRLERQTLRPVSVPPTGAAKKRRPQSAPLTAALTAMLLGLAASFAVVTAHATLPLDRPAPALVLASFDAPLGLPALVLAASPPGTPPAAFAGDFTKVSDLKANPYRAPAPAARITRAPATSVVVRRVSDLKANPYLAVP